MVKLSTALVLFLSFLGLPRCTPTPLQDTQIQDVYATPLIPPQKPVSVFHIGHSLVSRDMPAMLAQMAGPGHSYESQLGWGTSLLQHWEPNEAIKGADVENDHPRYRDARDAVQSGAYDVLVLTEAVEIRDSIKYNKSWDYLARWTKAARKANPDIRVYLYESWHGTDTAEGWLTRLDRDLSMHWEGEILDVAMAVDGVGPIYVIPAGQVFARFIREVEARGGIDGINAVEDLFSDRIHPNDVGAYLVALTHYAVIYGKSPEGLPHALKLHTGAPAQAPSAEAAAVMQRIVWEVVTSYARTGVPQTQ